MFDQEDNLYSGAVRPLNFSVKPFFDDIPSQFVQVLFPVDNRRHIVDPGIVPDPKLRRDRFDILFREFSLDLLDRPRLFACVNLYCHDLMNGFSSSRDFLSSVSSSKTI